MCNMCEQNIELGTSDTGSVYVLLAFSVVKKQEVVRHHLGEDTETTEESQM